MFLLPNILTLSRIGLIPVYIILFIQGYYYISGIIFIISALTDLFDGYIARKYNLKTKLGKLLDPLADKLTVISIFTTLLFMELVPEVIIIIILCREIIILLSSVTTFFMGKNLIDPTKIGKVSITILYIAIALLLMDKKNLAHIMLYTAIPLNIISAVDYIITAYNKIKA